MNINQHTILVTGGGSGIGFEIAKKFAEENNRVIITGRNKEKLDKAASYAPNITAITCDINDEEDVLKLMSTLQQDFPALDMVINNAGQASVYSLDTEHVNARAKAMEEMQTNYFSVIRMNELLLPLLKKQAEAAIVNVSSVVAFAPGAYLSTYAASKAAIHSYTQSLRVTLQHSGIRVFELMPPLVDTEFSKEIGGHNGIKPSVVAEELMAALKSDIYEIHVGDTAKIYALYLSSPQAAVDIMNSSLRAPAVSETQQ
jgi:uncharacterized oxidoreductase